MEEPSAAEFELTVSEQPGLLPAPGFHETRTRTYYVTAYGTVYLLAAPGQRAMLQAVEDLPPEAVATGRTVDMRLRTLADVADDLAAVRGSPSASPRPAPS